MARNDDEKCMNRSVGLPDLRSLMAWIQKGMFVSDMSVGKNECTIEFIIRASVDGVVVDYHLSSRTGSLFKDNVSVITLRKDNFFCMEMTVGVGKASVSHFRTEKIARSLSLDVLQQIKTILNGRECM